MQKLDLTSIEALMKRAASKATPASSDEKIDGAFLKQYFGFLPQDVEGIYTQKKDEGKGVWFKLKDGRVFSQHAVPSSADHSLYEKI